MTEFAVFAYKLPMKTPFRIAHGTYDYRENVFIRLRRDEVVVYGEAPIVPYYGVGVERVAADLRFGAEAALRSCALERGTAEVPHDTAFAFPASAGAFRNALLALRCARMGKTAAEMLGIEPAGAVPQSSFTLAFEDSVEDMVARARGCGFRRLKIKAGIPGDIERITAIRETLPDAVLRVDANQGWRVEEAASKMAALERLGVEFVEEPIAGTCEELEQLAAGSALPILLDESVRGAEELKRVAGAAPHIAGIVVKTAKTGGTAAALSLVRAAREAGMRVMLSSMVETSLGAAQALPLASLCSWVDLDAPLLLARDPFLGLTYVDERPTIEGGVRASPEFSAYADSVPAIRVER